MEFQNQILQSFLWHFTEQKFSNIGNFRIAVKDYQFFTTAELLFKIHNQVHEKLKDDDHHFFEGLELWTGENHN
ncbi:hypothetical protein [Sphingobacterium paramultivorum]|uniref:hypothetical protein n=1 Tax=Sphingobacterium paramultivorum TaxID=2886510 RepID=UPI00129C61E4|nr:hypothetical protein [Sphingobacterium paramultivorum]